jgi:Ca2+-binding RTX toxin-like protein
VIEAPTTTTPSLCRDGDDWIFGGKVRLHQRRQRQRHDRGGAGDDTIAGGAGNDVIVVQMASQRQRFGRDGRDTIDGGDDDDFLDAAPANDDLDGGDGDDIREVAPTTTSSTAATATIT